MKKYIIRNFKPGEKNHAHINPLLNLSKFGISNNADIMKSSLSLSASQTQEGGMTDQMYPNFYDAVGVNRFSKYRDLTKNSTNNYAFYDMSYTQRRDFCRQMARDYEINFVLNTIADEAIVPDENGYIAQLDIDRLKLFLNKSYNDKDTNTNADSLIRDCKIAFNTVYSCLGWDNNNGAWQYFKKFLIEGFLAFEILYDKEHKNIIGFLELDPVTLEPGTITMEDGNQLMVYFQYKGESRQKIIPDSNLIYISWNSDNAIQNYNNISYIEGLTRSFNMLRQQENSQMIWNIQNSQKRMKITIPVGDMSQAKAEERVNEIIADYTEEVTMDDASGQMLVNGEPKFNFQKTYVFDDRGGSTIGLEEVDTAGYDMHTTESLQYFWRKFILETQIPVGRFPLNLQAQTNQLVGDATVTREEYAFSRFIQRIQSMFKEIILKPVWIQVCLKHPELALTNYLKQGIGIKYNEENLFTLAKKRSIISDGASSVSTLLGIQTAEGKPYFAIEYAIKEYLGLSDMDLEINKKYKEAEILKSIENAKLQKKHAADKLAQVPQTEGVASFEGELPENNASEMPETPEMPENNDVTANNTEENTAF